MKFGTRTMRHRVSNSLVTDLWLQSLADAVFEDP